MMKTGKNAAATMKEKVSNTSASAKAEMEKAKARVEEKAERMGRDDPFDKERASERKQARVEDAEMAKREAHEENAAAKEVARGAASRSGIHPGGTEVRDTVVATKIVSTNNSSSSS